VVAPLWRGWNGSGENGESLLQRIGVRAQYRFSRVCCIPLSA
jgi:hypothetical protein